MSRPDPLRLTLLPDAPRRDFSRRRFLLSLGLLAGAVAAAPALSRLARRGAGRVQATRPVLGTWARIVVHDDDEARADRAIRRAWDAIARVDAQMSVHRTDSELARVNAAAGIAALPVSAALLEVVERARRAAYETARVHDPTVLPLMRLYGFYGSGRTHLPTDREIARTLALMGPHVVAIDRAAGTLGLTRRGAGLDLGSIGKGWAIDRAVDALRAEGVRSALVDVGRNVYGLGRPDDDAEGWRVGVLHPGTGRTDHVFVLRDMAVATSGNYEQAQSLDGRRVGHLLDALAGRPADPHLSATVLARSGLESDENASRAFLLGAGSVQSQPGVLATHVIG